MLPETFLAYETNATTVVLSAKYEYTFYFLGFSGFASTTPSSNLINSVMLRPRPDSTKEVPDIAAVNVSMNNGRYTQNFGFLLPMWNGGSVVEIDLKKIHTPKEMVQTHVYYLHAVGEVSGVQTVITTQTIPNLIKEGEYHISDPNMLCKYAAGLVTFEEILELAQKGKKEKEDMELLSKRLESALDRVRDKEDTVAMLEEEVERLEGNLEVVENNLTREFNERVRLQDWVKKMAQMPN